MSRLIKSSKFWALAFGILTLVAVAIFGQGDVQEWAAKLAAVLTAVAPVVYAVMTGLEDALSDGTLSLDELIALIKDVLDELNSES